jgi:hypothetical protein
VFAWREKRELVKPLAMTLIRIDGEEKKEDSEGGIALIRRETSN